MSETPDFERSWAEVRKIAEKQARKYDPYFVDHDDMVQDAMLRLLEQSARNGGEVPQGGLVRTAVTHSRARLASDGEHHTANRGRQELAQAQQRLEAERGRALSAHERDALAEEVRLGFPPGRRPPKGYQHQRSTVSIGGGERDDDHGYTVHPDVLTHQDQYPSEHTEAGDSAAFARHFERMVQDSEAHGDQQEVMARARRQLWRTFREDNPDIPRITQLGVGEVNTAKRAFRDAGVTPMEFAEAWLYGRSDTALEEAFFAPFGGAQNLSVAQQQAVAQRVTRDLVRGDKLWDAALEAASE